MGTTIKIIFTYLLLFGYQINLLALPSKIRAVFNEDPSTKITIIFDTSVAGTNPELFYGTSSQPVNSFTSSKAIPSIINTNSGMVNNIVRLDNLIPGTVYYFKIRDNSGSTVVYNFETISNQPTDRLSFIAGGDSRSNRSSRVNANKLVAKFKPHAVIFDGDMTDNGSAASWQYWFDDWQYTIDNANRVTPIIPARGNHEGNDNFLIDLFGSPLNVYYANTFGGNLLRFYTLNSEKAVSFYGNQTTWLLDDLNAPANSNVVYKFAQYHKPMRPHVATKLEGVAQYAYWSSIFYEHGFDVIVEGDAHTSKVTHPVIPCAGGYNCDDGFKRDDANGTVYVGEGCWGAPLRPANDNKIWTRDSGDYNQFKLMFVDLDGIEIRTILTDVETQVSEVNINNRFALPSNESSWRINDVVYLNNRKSSKTPTANLVSPPDNSTLYNTNPFIVYADASDQDGSIQRVEFYINGILAQTDSSSPYQFSHNPSSYGQYLIHAIAVDNTGLTSSISMSTIRLINNNSTITNTSKVNSTTDDAEEYSNGTVDLLNYDLDLGYNNAKCGVRFQKINIPKNATITNATIRFTADEIKHNTTALEIYAHDSASSETFFVTTRNISTRPKVASSVSWAPVGWTPVGASGADQTTPNLKSIVQELVNRPDWETESPMTFIFEGSGYRVGETQDGDSLNAAVLSVSYLASQDPPIVSYINTADTITCNKNDVISLKAIALFPSSTIDEIEFKKDNNSLGTFTNNPAQINAPTSVAGNFNIKVIAEDNQGKKGEDLIVLQVIDCNPVTGAMVGNFTTQSATITWNQITPSTVYKLQYRKAGIANWTSVNNITTESALLVNLAIVSNYEYRISHLCGSTTVYSSIQTFTTPGDCDHSTTQISAWEFNTSSNASIIHWDIARDATYKVFYKKVSENTWSSYCTLHPLVLLYGLDVCTPYQWYVQLVCSDYDLCEDAAIIGYKTSVKQLSTIGCKTEFGGADSNDIETYFKVSAYPLPMKDHLSVEFILPESSKTANVKLIDLNGKIIDSKIVEGAGKQHNVKFNVNQLISGTYLISVEDGKNSSYSKVLK